MPLSKFITQLQTDYPDFHFVYGKRFSFRPPKTIVIGPYEGEKTALLALHELGHGLSGAYSYDLDVERIKIESRAWQEAKKVYSRYAYTAIDQKTGKSSKKTANSFNFSLPEWDGDFVESQLDTYRDWLHTRSKCKKCGLTKYQTTDKTYHCPRCDDLLS